MAPTYIPIVIQNRGILNEQIALGHPKRESAILSFGCLYELFRIGNLNDNRYL